MPKTRLVSVVTELFIKTNATSYKVLKLNVTRTIICTARTYNMHEVMLMWWGVGKRLGAKLVNWVCRL